MKACFVFTATVLAVWAQICSAQGSGDLLNSEVYKDFERGMSLHLPNRSFYNGQDLEQTKPVQLVGAARSPENLEREDHIGRLVDANRKRLQFCFERVLAQGPLAVDSTVYFGVTKEGAFNNFTADVSASGSQENTQTLLSCVSRQLESLRAGKFDSDLAFRFKVKFASSH